MSAAPQRAPETAAIKLELGAFTRGEIDRAMEPVNRRIDDLADKVEKIADTTTSTGRDVTELSTTMKSYIVDAKEGASDHEKRIRSLEKWSWTVVGAAIVLGWLARYIFFNH